MLLVTPEDLAAETFLGNPSIAGIVGIRGATGWPWGEKGRGFIDDAVEDGLGRVSTIFGCSASLLEKLEPIALVKTARDIGASHIVTAFAPVGPIADALAAAEPELSSAGLSLVRVRRDWDDRFWPHATRGFFGVRNQICDGLAEDGLPA